MSLKSKHLRKDTKNVYVAIGSTFSAAIKTQIRYQELSDAQFLGSIFNLSEEWNHFYRNDLFSKTGKDSAPLAKGFV